MEQLGKFPSIAIALARAGKTPTEQVKRIRKNPILLFCERKDKKGKIREVVRPIRSRR